MRLLSVAPSNHGMHPTRLNRAFIIGEACGRVMPGVMRLSLWMVMRSTLQSFLLALLSALTLGAQEVVVTEDESAPRFENYRVGKISQGKSATLKLNSPNARMFRTRLGENAAGGVNFAGHYVLATWGCGSGCRSLAIIDVQTGRVYFTLSLMLVGTAMYQELDPLEFRADSRLLKVVGSRNDQGVGTYFYEWKNNRLRLVRAYEGKQVK